MPKSRLLLVRVILLGVVITLVGIQVARLEARQPKVGELYKMHCQDCHSGEGIGLDFTDGEWKYGDSAEAVAKSIREGYPDNGMPAYKNTFTDEQIRALVVYVRELQEKGIRQRLNPAVREGEILRSQYENFRIETVARGFEIPWSLDFLENGRLIVTERPGDVHLVEADGRVHPAVEGTPGVRARGQGGMLEVLPHDNYADNGWVYLSYSDGRDGGNTGFTKVVRGRIENNRWMDEEVIYEADEKFYTGGGLHFGSRLAFDREGRLYITIGDRGRQALAQELDQPQGKTHRVNEDGSIPEDNPFVDQADALDTVYTYGNRNAQGMDRHPGTGEIWQAEHGPRGGDELNVVKKGVNYGWPKITYGINYNGTPITDKTAMPGMEQPVYYWTPSIAVSSIAFYHGDEFPEWQNDLFITALAEREIWRFRLDGHEVAERELLLDNIGRIRDVEPGPDGYLYIATESPHQIIRLVPAS